jgi:hypothetical protein
LNLFDADGNRLFDTPPTLDIPPDGFGHVSISASCDAHTCSIVVDDGARASWDSSDPVEARNHRIAVRAQFFCDPSCRGVDILQTIVGQDGSTRGVTRPQARDTTSAW